jgi:mannose-6-phosphate isomerase-like protein (cupin superfamily)
MRIAYARREEMNEIDNVHGGAGPILFTSLFSNTDFETPWWFVHAAIIPPGGGIGHHRHDTCEEVFVTVDNAAQFTHNGRTAEVIGGAAVPLRKGESHAIYNHTDKETRWFNFNVADVKGRSDSTDFGDDRANAPLESVDRLPVGRLDRSLLTYRRIHDGKGECGIRMIWGHQDFQNNWGFVAHAVVPPGASVGYHRHDVMEEIYIIINGSGRMTVDDETEEVYEGAAIPNRLGGSHGIYNHTQEDLEMLVVAVCSERGKTDAIDLKDDLTGR